MMEQQILSCVPVTNGRVVTIFYFLLIGVLYFICHTKGYIADFRQRIIAVFQPIRTNGFFVSEGAWRFKFPEIVVKGIGEGQLSCTFWFFEDVR